MKTTLLVRSLLVMMLLTAMGCSDWARRPDSSGLLIEPHDAAALGYTVNWSIDLNIPNRHKFSSITLLGDILFTVEAPGNMVTAISIRDGQVLWRRVIGEQTENIYPPIRDEDRVYFNNDTMFYTLGIIKGNLISTSKLTNVVETGPLLMDRFAIFGAADGTVFAHDIDTGYPKWSYLMSSGIVVTPIRSQRNLFVTDSMGVYALFKASDGEMIFRGRTFGPISAQPATSRDKLFIASRDQTLYAINRLNGQDNWVYRTASQLTESPTAIGSTVYLPLPGKDLVALKAEDGSVLWNSGIPAKVVGESGNKVMLHYLGGLRWVDKSNGRVLTDVQTQQLQTVISVPDAGGMLAVSPYGRIHRLLPRR